MAYYKRHWSSGGTSRSGVTPAQDTGWGLIFRLNDLFGKIENVVPNGDFNTWNILLDRIFCNLSYRQRMVVGKDGEGKIVSVEMDEESKRIFQFLNKEVFEAKKKISEAGRKENFSEVKIAKGKLYNALIKKDIWLRKYMHNELGIYLKEVEYDPSKAIYGG